MKSTSLFGGVQVFNILINIIKTKFLAVLIGPAGLGIIGLFDSVLNFISTLTEAGLSTSAVNPLSVAFNDGNKKNFALIAKVIKRLILFTGLAGMILTIILSPWLSEITFGNKDYSFAFIYVSCSVLFKQLTHGQGIILRSTRKLRLLAKANLIGSILGLFVTVPIYYFLGINGIVPGIIFTALSSATVTWFYSNKLDIEKTHITLRDTASRGKEMMAFGSIITLSSLITMGADYILRVYISQTGGFEHVGFFSAGYAFTNSYVALILAAVGNDYYPRLTVVASDKTKANALINNQLEISLLIISPVVILFLTFINFIILLIYSEKFFPIKYLILWFSFGTFFKIISWIIGYIIRANSDKYIYLTLIIIFNLYSLGLNITGYYLGGLTGLGISYFTVNIIYFIQIFFLTRKNYGFAFNYQFYSIFLIQLILVTICFIIVIFADNYISYFTGIIIFLISLIYSLKELNKRLNLKKLIISVKTRISKNS